MPIRHATLHQLKIFEALSQHMSISRTAEALHLSPPAVSIQVKQLAESAGEPLLEQVGKKIYLTNAGKAVAAASRDIFERLESLTQELAGIQNLERGSLSVGLITTAKYFIPRLLGNFSDSHKDIEIALFIGNRETILSRLNQNQDDLYVLGRPPDNLKVDAIAFAPNPIIAVANPEHPLRNKKKISAETIGKERFILRELGSGIRASTLDYFRQRNATVNIRMQLDTGEAIKQTIMARLGISFMAESSVQAELDSGELIKLDVEGLPIQRQWYVVHHQKVISPIAQSFKDYLINEFKNNEIS